MVAIAKCHRYSLKLKERHFLCYTKYCLQLRQTVERVPDSNASIFCKRFAQVHRKLAHFDIWRSVETALM